MGYDYNVKRIKSQQKTVHPPEELTPRQVEKWLNEQAVLFERDCRHTPQPVQQLTLAKYIDLWLTDIAPGKLAKSTIRRDRQDIERILPVLGHYKLTELRPEHFRNFYAELRKVISPDTKKPLSEYTIEGVHATLCSILSDAVEGGFLSHNPAWRTYRYADRKCEKKIADEETAQRIIAALEGESIKYETYFKLIIATGMRRGECCGLKWCDIDWEQRSIHICRNAVKVMTDEDKLMQAGMVQSMSRVAHCIDNGSMEGFWDILKRERYYGRRFTSKRDLVQMIETYIHYYNTRRVQRNLGVLTPMEKHALCLAA